MLRGYRDRSAATAGSCSSSYRLVDVARKVVGVGSVGTRAWIVLLLGRDGGDPLFLQVKEAQAVGARGVRSGASEYATTAQRVVAGQRLMQAASDIFLGWLHVDAGSTACRATTTSASSATGRARVESSR